MRLKRSLLIIIWAAILCVVIMKNSVLAVATSQDGLEVILTTDKEEYDNNDEITATLTVKNTNDFPVNNVLVKGVVPKGYELVEGGEESSSVETLEAGEFFTVTIKYICEKEEVEVPNTGNRNNAILWSVLLGISIGALIAGFLVSKKNCKNLLSVLLCIIIVGTSINWYSVKIDAAMNVNVIKVEKVVRVIEKEVILKAVVEYGNYENIHEYIDTDGDGVIDGVEEYFGTSVESKDTDNDGLNDNTEIYITDTNPILVDTDGDGIFDADEDADEDELTNGEEQKNGTDSRIVDTDNDGLSDGKEVKVYKTSPVNEDTDGDGLSDGDEIILGLNPLKVSTDGIVLDIERTFEQFTDDSVKDEALKNSENWLDVNIFGKVPGVINKNVSMNKGSAYYLESNRSVVSDIIDVYTDYEIPVTISFKCLKKYSGDINNLNIMTFTEDGLIPIETVIDETSNTIYAQLQKSGTYFVVDLDEFLKGLGIDVFSNLISEYQAGRFDVRMLERETKTTEKVCVGNDDLYDSKIETDVFMSGFTAYTDTYTTRFAALSKATGKADVVFVIDATGSMYNAIEGVKGNISNFTKALVNEYNIDVNFALIEYRDITVDGKESTILHRNTSGNWYTNVDSYINRINNLYVDGGGDLPETPIDALEMARTLDWRGDATKFIIVVTDANSKKDNSYGILDMEEMSELLVNDNIITSAISPYEDYYDELTELSGGLYGDIYGEFSDILIRLADMVGETTNSNGEWVFLDDFQAIKLSDTLANAEFIDTDGDGYNDAKELGTSKEVNMESYILRLLDKYSVPHDAYVGKKTLTVWEYISNPTLVDTDYDGIPDGTKDYDGSLVEKPDTMPRRTKSFVTGLSTGKNSNQFKGTVTDHGYEIDVNFIVDYSLLFNDLSNYNRNLSKMGSIYSIGAYNNDYYISSGANFTGNDEGLMKNFGMKNIIAYKVADDYTDDDLSEITIGHREVTYRGVTKDIILISVRGTDATIEEWSSNFDVGADTEEYWDRDNSDWKEKQHHKGFDVAANRLDQKCIQQYIDSLDASIQKVIYITGHSRGAAIANILAAMYVDRGYATVAYTMATPNTTLKDNVDSYKTIFNVVNADDLVPQLPLDKWGYSKYGKTYSISIKEKYEDKFGRYDDGTWEAMFNHDYNFNGNLKETLNAFSKLLENREQIYQFTGEDNTIYIYEKEYGTKDVAIQAKNDLYDKYGMRISRFCKFKIEETEKFFGGVCYQVAVEQSPAAMMMILTDVVGSKQHKRTDTGDDSIVGYDQLGAGEDKFMGQNIGFYVAKKYKDAKAEFVWSGADSTGGAAMNVRMGGMLHTHMPSTYYLITNDSKECIR